MFIGSWILNLPRSIARLQSDIFITLSHRHGIYKKINQLRLTQREKWPFSSCAWKPFVLILESLWVMEDLVCSVIPSQCVLLSATWHCHCYSGLRFLGEGHVHASRKGGRGAPGVYYSLDLACTSLVNRGRCTGLLSPINSTVLCHSVFLMRRRYQPDVIQ